MNRGRLVKVRVSFPLLLEMMVQGWHTDPDYDLVCTEGLPEDVEFIYSYFDELHMEAWLVFQHPSFAQLQPGDEIPDFKPEFMKMIKLVKAEPE